MSRTRAAATMANHLKARSPSPPRDFRVSGIAAISSLSPPSPALHATERWGAGRRAPHPSRTGSGRDLQLVELRDGLLPQGIRQRREVDVRRRVLALGEDVVDE